MENHILNEETDKQLTYHANINDTYKTHQNLNKTKQRRRSRTQRKEKETSITQFIKTEFNDAIPDGFEHYFK